LPPPWECQAQKATYKTNNTAARVSSNHIYVSFSNLCFSAEANHAVKLVIHQTEMLRADSMQHLASLILDECSAP
jgi:hypothetical protein